MEFASTVDFAHAARRLTSAAQRRGLVGPNFRCPPRLVGVDRTIRRRRRRDGGGAVVSIRVIGRPREAVIADMIEGIVVVNELRPPDADRVRTELWTVMATDERRDAGDGHRGAA